MFRTRDFVLLFTVVVFLLVAIGTTIFRQHQNSEQVASAVRFTEVPDDRQYSAAVPEVETFSREERLADMRRKIADGGALAYGTAEMVVIDEVAIEEVGEALQSEEPVSEVMYCSSNAPYSGLWSPQGVQFEVTEGARVVYRIINQPVLAATGTPAAPLRELLLQLPAQPFASSPSCLASDVVGVAQDGSLIRNDEVGLYGVFGEGTLIGYALDGFPIYGMSATDTDTCGGTSAAGTYRYYLSEGRDAILNCFMGSPVSL